MPRVAAPSAGTGLGTKPCSASKGGRPRKFAGGCKAKCSDIPWTDTSSPAAGRTSRYRTSELLARQTEQRTNVNPLFSLNDRTWSFLPRPQCNPNGHGLCCLAGNLTDQDQLQGPGSCVYFLEDPKLVPSKTQSSQRIQGPDAQRDSSTNSIIGSRYGASVSQK